MTYRIVADSSANLLTLDSVDFISVPLKIVTSEKEYVDDDALDVDRMVAELLEYKGRSGSSCPNIQDWLDAFRGADGVFVVTITSGLSGSYASAVQAKTEFEKNNSGSKIYVIDSLSAGPEPQLIVEKLGELILQGLSFDDIVDAIEKYRRHTHLLFSLASMKNLARNGRTSHAVATIADVLDIQVVGRASESGTLEVLHKCRGSKRTLQTTYNSMVEHGYSGGRVRIAQCQNLAGADALRSELLQTWPKADIRIVPCRGLCAFYAESGGLMIGYEG